MKLQKSISDKYNRIEEHRSKKEEGMGSTCKVSFPGILEEREQCIPSVDKGAQEVSETSEIVVGVVETPYKGRRRKIYLVDGKTGRVSKATGRVVFRH